MTGLPSRTTSVMTATTEVVISEKSKLEFLMSDLSGIAHSRMSTIRIGALFLLIPVTVRAESTMVLAVRTLGLQQVARLAGVATRRRSTGGDDYGRQRSFRCSPGNAGVCRKERRAGAAGLRRLYFRGAPSRERVRRQAETARKGAKDVTEKAMTFAERNITSAFEFAQELVRAKDMQDVLRLQADYIQRQMQALTEQAKELGESTSKAAKDTAPR